MRNTRENAGFSDDLRLGLPGGQAQANQIRRMPAGNPDQVFFHLDFARSLQMHRTMAIGIFLAGLVLCGLYMSKRWNTYKSEALVYVQPSPHKVLESGPAQQWPYDANTYESYIQQQVNNVTRPDVLAKAVKQIPGWRGSDESEQSAADRLGSNIDVKRVGSAYEISITGIASSAAEAAQMANAVASSFIDSATREQRAGDPERLELLRGERDRVLKELASDRTEQEDLNRQLGVAAVATTPDPYDDQISATRAELVKARTANDEAAAKLTALGSASASNAAMDAEADEMVAADPGLVSMKTALNKRKSELISQMANLTPSHPLYKQDSEELAKINTSLDAMTKDLRAKAATQIRQKLKNDLERTSQVESRLNGQLAQLTGAAGSATPRLQRSHELATDIQRLQNRFAVVDEQYRNLTMENNAPGAVYLASAALPPLHAARTKIYRNGFIVLLAGLVFALGGALAAHNFDQKIYIATDVERVLGFPPMAQLPDLYEVGTGVAEEYMLRLAAAVEHAHQQGILSSCIFTGVTPGAGVTTVSSRVSSMLEAMGRETVLVNAAGSPPPIPAAAEPGTDLVQAARGSRSTALLQQMTQETDADTIVVTDTAPLLISGETEYLARFVDSAIVVIESGVTTKAQLREVAQNLQRLQVASVGFVLNRIALRNANPAFRQSVHAVEIHLRVQARAFDRPAPAPEPRVEPLAEAPKHSSDAFQRLWNIVSEPANDAPPLSSDSGEEFATRTEELPAPAPASFPPPSAAELAPVLASAPASERVPQPAPHPAPQEAAEIAPPVPQPPGPAVAAIHPEPVIMPAAPKPHVPQVAPAAENIAPTAPRPEPVWNAVETDTHQPRTEYRTPASGYVARPMRGRETARLVPVPPRPAQPAPMPEPVPQFAAHLEPLRQVAAHRESERQVEPEPIGAPVPAPVTAAEIEPDIETVIVAKPEPQPAPAYAPAAVRPSLAAQDPFATRDAYAPAAPAVDPEMTLAATAPLLVPATWPTQSQTQTQPPPQAQPIASAEPEPAPAVVAPAELEELSYNPASRLGGLRTLMVSLGMKKLHKEAELRNASDPEDTFDRLPERPVYAQPDVPEAAGEQESSSPALVKAEPEIIPPRLAAVEPIEHDKDAHRTVKSPQVSRWDSPDDLDTLPSRRGQYRKRR